MFRPVQVELRLPRDKASGGSGESGDRDRSGIMPLSRRRTGYCRSAGSPDDPAETIRQASRMSNVETIARWAAAHRARARRPFRQPPHNVEAEQALLGAILVNNDAFDRVSDFLLPEHFSRGDPPPHLRGHGSLVRGGKIATPITLKTFLGDHDLGGITVPQYLARLAAEATTIINAADYGRMIYDLAMRRGLITIGEEIVNVAFDAPVDHSPREQIEEAERQLYAIAESGRAEGGFQRFSDGADHRHRRRRQGLRARRQARRASRPA